MASRPVSNRRRNYSRATDGAAAEDNPWREPGESDRLTDYEGYTDEPSYTETASDAVPRGSADYASTAGRPSGDFHDAYDEYEAYEDHPRHASRAAEEESVPTTSLYADEPEPYNDEYHQPHRYAPGARNYSATGGAREYADTGDGEVHIERPHTNIQDSRHFQDTAPDDHFYYDPSFPEPADDEDPEDFPAFFHHEVGHYGEYNLLSRLYLELRQMMSFIITGISFGVIVNFAFIHYMNPFRKSPPKARCEPEFERRITGERLSERVEYYAEYWGYKCEEHDIVTRGGWILKAHRISDPRRPGGRGYPVIIQHGILCSSLFYFTNEERSLGFWLVDQGFDVWSTNIRSNYGAGHTRFGRWDPRFWAWSVMELAYDLVDVVDFVLEATGFRQLAFVGHSQGTGSMFLALSHGKYPELGHKLSSFTALGPAVFPGPSLRRFPFAVMAIFQSRFAWSLIFGVRDFMPMLDVSRKLVPAFLFGHIGFILFSYLFDFHDHNWVNRLKPKIFRATGISTSSELLYFYMRSFVGRGCIFDPQIATPWFPRSFPPLTVVYGTTDYLVVGKPLIDRLLKYERNVEIVHILELQGYEHMDMVLGVDAYKIVFPRIKDTILRTMDPEDVPTKVMM